MAAQVESLAANPSMSSSPKSPAGNSEANTFVTPRRQIISECTTPSSLRSVGLTPKTSVIPLVRLQRGKSELFKRRKRKFSLIPTNMKNLRPMKEVLKLHFTDRWVELAKYGWKFMDGKYIAPNTKIKYAKGDKSGKKYDIMGKEGVNYFTKSKDMLNFLKRGMRESARRKAFKLDEAAVKSSDINSGRTIKKRKVKYIDV